jgi:hypothetical protein
MVGVFVSALSAITATAKDASRLDLRAFFMFLSFTNVRPLIAGRRQQPG